MMATPMAQLSTGVLLKIMNGEREGLDDPILQILQTKKLQLNPALEDYQRFRMILSDGKYLISHGMYTSSSIDHQFPDNQIPDNTIVKLTKYTIHSFGPSKRNLLHVAEMKLLQNGDQVDGIIGEPMAFPSDLINVKPDVDVEPARKRPNLEVSTASFSNFTIMTLSPYCGRQWKTKVRVINKSSVRPWSNSRGEGKRFFFDIMDETGEMRVTAFCGMVDKCYDLVQVGKVYYISKGSIKTVNNQYPTPIKNEFEMSIGSETIIEECTDDDSDIPTAVPFDFVTIDKIAELEADKLIDIIGVCKHSADVQSLTSRGTGRDLKKRDILLVDHTKAAIILTLWDTDAEQFNDAGQVIAVKGARVTEFGGGKSLSMTFGAIYKANPDMQEAFNLRGWYDHGGNEEDAANVSTCTSFAGDSMNTPWMSFRQVQEENLGGSPRGDFYQNIGTILMIQHQNLLYDACTTAGCNKKVINLNNGMYRCEKCNLEKPACKYRLLAHANVGDWSGSQWMTIFNDECEALFGATAEEIGERAKADPSYITNLLEEMSFQDFHFKCRVKTDIYNDESRLNTVAVKVEPVDYEADNERLISEIEEHLHNL